MRKASIGKIAVIFAILAILPSIFSPFSPLFFAFFAILAINFLAIFAIMAKMAKNYRNFSPFLLFFTKNRWRNGNEPPPKHPLKWMLYQVDLVNSLKLLHRIHQLDFCASNGSHWTPVDPLGRSTGSTLN